MRPQRAARSDGGATLNKGTMMRVSKFGPEVARKSWDDRARWTDRDWIVYYMEKSGLTQGNAARELDVNPRTIRRYCDGSPVPKVVVLALRWLAENPPTP